MIILNYKGAKLEWDEEIKAVVKTALGFLHGDEVREIFNTGAKILSEKGCKVWISDNQLLTPYSIQDMKWLKDSWMPDIAGKGLKYYLFVEPDSSYGKISMENFIFSFSGYRIEVREFATREEAISFANSLNS